MSLAEILDQLPKLKIEERDVILHRLEQLDDLGSPELLAAVDEADASPPENDLSADELLQKVKTWTGNTK